MLMVVEILESFLGQCRGHNQGSGQIQFDCPVCSEEQGKIEGNGKGNLEINYNKGFYHCWVCGERNRMKGYLPNLIKRFGNEKLLRDFLLVKPEFKVLDDTIIKKIKLPEEFIPLTPENKNMYLYFEALNYLNLRGITDDLIKKYNIGFCNKGRYANRIIIPSYDINGELNFFIGRTFKNWVKPKILNEIVEKSLIIFNEEFINWDSTIYLVEGPFDHVVTYNSIPLLGKYVSPYLFHMLQTKAKGDIVILLDGDAYNDAKLLYKELNVGNLRDRVKIITLTKDYDPSKAYETFGRKEFVKILSTAHKISEFKL